MSSSAIFAQLDPIDAFLAEKMSEHNIPGLQFSIVKNQKIVKSGSFGIANIEDGIPVDQDTVFAINSMTKAFTGVALMQLVEQRKLDLNATISAFVPNLPPSWQTVTIKELAAHTSGLPDVLEYLGPIFRLKSPKGETATWELVQTLPIEFKQNTEFKYNQTNYILLGKVITKLTGIPFTEAIIQYQLKPAQLERTIEAGFLHYDGVIRHSARGYIYYLTQELTHIYEHFPPSYRAAAGMSSTATELAQWLIALIQNKFLSKESVETLWSPQILTNGQPKGFGGMFNGYAIGWPIVQDGDTKFVAPIGGARSAMMYDPQEDIGVVILTNLQGARPEKFMRPIMEMVKRQP